MEMIGYDHKFVDDDYNYSTNDECLCGYSGIMIISKKLEIDFVYFWENSKLLEREFRVDSYVKLIDIIKKIICTEVALYEFKPIFEKGLFHYFVLKKRNHNYIVFCRKNRKTNPMFIFENLRMIHKKFKCLSVEDRSCEMVEFLNDMLEYSTTSFKRASTPLMITPEKTNLVCIHSPYTRARSTTVILNIIEKVDIKKNQTILVDGECSFNTDCINALEVKITLNEAFNDFVSRFEGREEDGNYLKRNEPHLNVCLKNPVLQIPQYHLPKYPSFTSTNELMTYRIASNELDAKPVELFFNMNTVKSEESYSIIGIWLGLGIRKHQQIFNFKANLPVLKPSNILGIKTGCISVGNVEIESDKILWEIGDLVPNDRPLKCAIYIKIPSSINPKECISRPKVYLETKKPFSGFGFHSFRWFVKYPEEEKFTKEVHFRTIYHIEI